MRNFEMERRQNKVREGVNLELKKNMKAAFRYLTVLVDSFDKRTEVERAPAAAYYDLIKQNTHVFKATWEEAGEGRKVNLSLPNFVFPKKSYYFDERLFDVLFTTILYSASFNANGAGKPVSVRATEHDFAGIESVGMEWGSEDVEYCKKLLEKIGSPHFTEYVGKYYADILGNPRFERHLKEQFRELGDNQYFKEVVKVLTANDIATIYMGANVDGRLVLTVSPAICKEHEEIVSLAAVPLLFSYYPEKESYGGYLRMLKYSHVYNALYGKRLAFFDSHTTIALPKVMVHAGKYNGNVECYLPGKQIDDWSEKEPYK